MHCTSQTSTVKLQSQTQLTRCYYSLDYLDLDLSFSSLVKLSTADKGVQSTDNFLCTKCLQHSKMASAAAPDIDEEQVSVAPDTTAAISTQTSPSKLASPTECTLPNPEIVISTDCPKVPPQRPPPPKIGVSKSLDDIDSSSYTAIDLIVPTHSDEISTEPPNKTTTTSPPTSASDKSKKKNGFSKFKTDAKLKKRFNTFTMNTKDLTTKVYKRITKTKTPFRSHTLGDKVGTGKNKLQHEDHVDYSLNQPHDDEEIIVGQANLPMRSAPPILSQTDRSFSLSLTHKAPPKKTYQSFQSVISLDQLVDTDEQVLASFPIMRRIVHHVVQSQAKLEVPPAVNGDIAKNSADEEGNDDKGQSLVPESPQSPEFSPEVSPSSDSVELVEDCLSAFIGSGRRQVKDELAHINSSLAASLDLDSVGLLTSQTGPMAVSWITGWRQVRLVEDASTHDRFIVLKNSYSKTWVCLSKQKLKCDKRWLCFPLESVNTLANELQLVAGKPTSTEDDKLVVEEVNLEEETNRKVYRKMLRLIVMMAVNKLYENDRSPDNIDPTNVLLIASRFGLIVVFHECLTESRLLSMDFLRCETVADVPVQLERAKVAVYRLAEPLLIGRHNPLLKATVSKPQDHKREDIITLLIASTWPLDYLLLLLAELMEDANCRADVDHKSTKRALNSSSSSASEQGQNDDDDDDD